MPVGENSTIRDRRPRAATGATAKSRVGMALERTVPISQPTVFIVSGVRLFREGLFHQLRRDARLNAVGIGAPGDDSLRAILSAKPDAVALDLTGGAALRFAEDLRARAPRIKLIGFAVGEQDAQLAQWARSGVCGYVEQEGTSDDIVAAVLQALKGELHCSPRFAARLFAQLAAGASPAAAPNAVETALTRREREILREIECGASNKEIARRLGITVATVKNHVHRVLEKLSVRRRAEASAMLRGIRPPDAPSRRRGAELGRSRAG